MKENKKLYLLAAVVFVAVAAAYSNHFLNSFHFDDSHTIVNNVYIRNIGNIPLFFMDGSTFSSLPSNQSYRPLVTATAAIDYYLGGGNTFPFHLSTFVFFILQGFLMYLFFLKIFDRTDKNSANPFIALIAVAWYMLHPANAETINYIIARSDSLSTFFIILAFVMFLYFPFARKRHLHLLPAAVGALAKPIAGVFAPLFFTYLLIFEKNPASPEKKPGGRKKHPTAEKDGVSGWSHVFKNALPAFIFVFAVMLFIKKMDPPTWTPGGASFHDYVITQPLVILRYFMTFFLPVSLSADTDMQSLSTMADIRFIAGMTFLILLIAAAVTSLRYKNLRPLAFGIFWFIITLAPTSLIPLSEVMNDHRIFLPFVGLSLGFGWSASLCIRKLANSSKSPGIVMRSAAVFITIALLAYAYGVHERNKAWRTEETLWKDVTEKSPKNGRGLMNYGLALMAKADYDSAGKYFGKALELMPNYSYLHINMAILDDSIGKPEEAENYFRSAITNGQGYPETYFYYARFLFKHKRYDEAEENLKKAIQLASAHLNARYLLMDLYYDQRDYGKLADIAEDTLRVAPNDGRASSLLNLVRSGNLPLAAAESAADENMTPESLLELSLTYYQSGDYEKSVDAAREALKLRPYYDSAYINICAAYNQLEEWDKAVEAGENAVKLDPDNQLAKNNLAFARKRQAASAKSGSRTKQ